MRSPFLFDMDGTLVDSLDDIGNSMNAILARYGFAPHPRATYLQLVGDGARSLVERSLPPEARHLVDEALAHYKVQYRANLVATSRPYDGIVTTLEHLAVRGHPLAIVTNKPESAAVEVARALFPTVSFVEVVGQRDGVPHKPDPTGAHQVAARLSVDPAGCFFVGDTDVDMQTASRAGMIAVGVLWGFRGEAELRAHGARHILARPSELLDLVGAT